VASMVVVICEVIGMSSSPCLSASAL